MAIPTCLSCKAMEPDVVIVVGCVEFREYSPSLCCRSGFFDAALGNGMKESTTKEFHFPAKCPEEWQLVVSLASRFSKDKLAADNVQTVLPWFDELHCIRVCHRNESYLGRVGYKSQVQYKLSSFKYKCLGIVSHSTDGQKPGQRRAGWSANDLFPSLLHTNMTQTSKVGLKRKVDEVVRLVEVTTHCCYRSTCKRFCARS